MTQDRALGQYLADQDWIRPDQLAKALSTQAVVGGRLGTCLLEMEAVTEDRLLKGLSAQSGVPGVGADDLRQIPQGIIDLVPAKIAGRLKVVPFGAELGRLDVAMIDVFDLSAQDELAFVTGKRIRVFITIEVRLRDALDRYYKIECPSRYAHLLDRMNRARYLWAQNPPEAREKAPGSLSGVFQLPPQDLPVSRPTPQRSSARPSIPSIPNVARPPSPAPSAQPAVRPNTIPSARPRPRPAVIQLTETERKELMGRQNAKAAPAPAAPTAKFPPGPPPARREAPASRLTTFEHLAERLATPSDRDEVGEILLEFLGERFGRAALLMVRVGEIHGWMGIGPELSEKRLESYQIDFSQPSVFLNLKLGAPFHLGPLAPMATHHHLVECWNGKLPRECLVLPVRIKERLVTFLYIDSGDEPLTGVDIDLMQRVAGKVAGAFELCILRNKLKSN